MAIANQPTAADTVQTIEKLEDELNGIGNYDLMDSGKKLEERKIPLHLQDDPEFLARKTAMIQKIARSMYQSEYTYIDYLDHIMTDCDDSLKVEYGCTLPKCKSHNHVMSLKDLRLHLVNDCNKITMFCNICGETFRRPWAPYHECVRVYRVRLEDKDVEIDEI